MANLLEDPKNNKLLSDFLHEHAPLINYHINSLKKQGRIPEGIDESKVQQAAVRGLMTAMSRHNPNVAKLRTYASKSIAGSIKEFVDRVVPQEKGQQVVPKHIIKQQKNLAEQERKEAAAPVKTDVPKSSPYGHMTPDQIGDAVKHPVYGPVMIHAMNQPGADLTNVPQDIQDQHIKKPTED